MPYMQPELEGSKNDSYLKIESMKVVYVKKEGMMVERENRTNCETVEFV